MITKHALKLYALAATACSAVLLLRQPPQGLAPSPDAPCRPTRALFGATWSPSAAASPDAPFDHEELLAKLLAARPGAPRCALLARLPGSVPDALAAQALGKLVDTSLLYADRECVLQALGQLADPASLTLLLGLAREIETRDGALSALGRRSDSEARRALIALAEDEDDPLRVPAITALAAVGEPAVVPLILDALTSARADERYPLVIALGQSGDPRALPALEQLASTGSPQDRTLALEALAQHQSADGIALIRRIITDQPQLAVVAASALANARSPEAEALLLELAEGPSVQVANAALGALSALDTPAVRALMMKAAAQANVNGASTAYAYLARHADDAALDLLTELCSTGREHACGYVGEACVQLGSDDALERLVELAERGGTARILAFQALPRMRGGPERVRQLALESTKRGGGEAESALMVLAKDDHPDTLRRLLEIARSGDSQLAASAMQQLSLRGDAEGTRALLDLAKNADGRDDLRGAALNALAQASGDKAALAAEEALRTGGPALRSQAAQVLVATRGPAAEASLLSAARAADKDPEALGGITSALVQLGTPAAVDKLEQIATKGLEGASQQALAALAEHAPARAARVAEQLIASSEPSVRSTALAAVGAMPSDVAKRLVVQALGSSDESLVQNALNLSQLVGLGGAEREALLRRAADNTALSEALRQQLAAMASGVPPPAGMVMERVL